MAALLDDVAARLVAQSVGGLPGTTQATDTGWVIAKAFELDQAPGTGVNSVLTLQEYEHATPFAHVDQSYDVRRFQVKARSKTPWDYATAETKILAVRTALATTGKPTFNSYPYLAVRDVTGPIPMGVDANSRPALVMNFEAARSRTS